MSWWVGKDRDAFNVALQDHTERVMQRAVPAPQPPPPITATPAVPVEPEPVVPVDQARRPRSSTAVVPQRHRRGRKPFVAAESEARRRWGARGVVFMRGRMCYVGRYATWRTPQVCDPPWPVETEEGDTFDEAFVKWDQS